MKDERSTTVTIDFEGKAIEARATDTIAAALLRDGVQTFSRGPKYHRPRGAFCLTGNCAQCHMRVGDEPNVPTCTTPVRRGLHVERQNVLGTGDVDLLRAVDFLYPEGIDHHHLMTRFKLLNEATKVIARRLAGIGKVPSVPTTSPNVKVLQRPLVIIGAGPSGLAAAREAIRLGITPLVLDSRDVVGGHVADGFHRPGDSSLRELREWAEEVEKHGELELGASVGGLYSEGGGHFVVAAVDETFWLIQADGVIAATGGQERNLVFESNDLPGIFSGRGLLRLVRNHAVLPGRRAVVVADHPDAMAVAEGLQSAGIDVETVLDTTGKLEATVGRTSVVQGQPVAALGRTSVTGLRIRLNRGVESDLECDLIAVVAPPTPCYELAAEVGATTHYDAAAGGFVLSSDAEGRTSLGWLFAAGRVAGANPVESGIRAAQSAVRALTEHRAASAG